MKVLFFILFLAFIDIYFYLGTISIIDKWFKNPIIYKIVYWLLSFSVYLFILYVVYIYTEGYTDKSLSFNNKNIVYTSLFFVVLISKFIGLLPLIFDDFLRLFRFVGTFFNNSDTHDVKRLDFLKKSALLLSGALFSTLLIGMKWGRYNFKRNYQDIMIPDWPHEISNYKIIHISDLHLGSFNDIQKIDEVVELINSENADLVVFTGDLVNNYYDEANPYIDSLKKIKAKDGKLSILGNHDYGDYTGMKRDSIEWKDNFKNLVQLQKDIGFDLLLNESRVVSSDQNKRFNIVGVENWGAGRFNKDGDLDLAMKSVDDRIPTILLSHDPSHWSEVVLKSDYKIDLQLSGHTHGMQFGIEIPGFKWSPSQYRYKEWAGLYENSGKQIYVNRGLGHLGYAGRVGIMPDISVLNIMSKN